MIEEAIRLADEVPGWMSPEELRWLAEQASERQVIYEVGCWQGRSTKAISHVCPGTVHAVDPFVGEVGEPVEDLEGCFRANLAEEIEARKVKPIPAPSVETAKSLEPGSADMVFIDGNHIAPAPYDDIDAWWPVLKDGGLMCGHDDWMEGVALALLAIDHDWKRDAPGSLWYAVK